MAFGREAVRSAAKLKIALQGPGGSGKTTSALIMAGVIGRKVGLLDSEFESALKSVGRTGVPPFRHEPLKDPTLQDYIEMTRAAEEAGIDVLIYDSWSHSWTSALEAVDAQASTNKFANWKTVTPLVKKLIRKMVSYPGHCIATFRVDTEWVIEKDERTGKNVPRKIGTKPVAGKGAEYEFDFVLELIADEKVIVQKTRNGELLPLGSIHDRSELPKIAHRLVDWLNEGAEETTEAKLGRRIDVADSAELVAMLPELQEFTKSNPEGGARLRPRYLARKERLAAGGGG